MDKVSSRQPYGGWERINQPV